MKPTTRLGPVFTATLLLSTAALLACSDERDRPDAGPRDGSTDGATQDGGTSDGGGSDGGGMSDGGGSDGGGDETPILARTVRSEHTCAVGHELSNYTPLRFGRFGYGLAQATDGKVWLARTQTTNPDPFSPGDPTFVVSTIAADGTLGTETPIAVSDAGLVSYPAVVGLDGGAFGVVWIENETLTFAAFDSNGAVVVAPAPLPSGTVNALTAPKIIRTQNGRIGIVWVTASASSGSDVRFLSIDAAGTSSGSAITIAHTALESYNVAADITPIESGFAIAYPSLANGRPSVSFTQVDDSGATTVDPKAISTAAEDIVGGGFGFAPAAVSLLALDGGFVASWIEGTSGDPSGGGGGYSVVRVSSLAANGDVVASAILREKKIDFEEVEPALIRFGDRIGVLWATGSIIYICGGCVPDEKIQMVLIDPTDLVPVSNTVEILHQEPQGGLLRRRTALSGADILMTFEITYHVSSDSGFAAFHCE